MLCGARVSQRMNLIWSVSNASKRESLSVVVSQPYVMTGMVNILYSVMCVAKSRVFAARVERDMEAWCAWVARVMQWVRSATVRVWPVLPSVSVQPRSLKVETRWMVCVPYVADVLSDPGITLQDFLDSTKVR